MRGPKTTVILQKFDDTNASGGYKVDYPNVQTLRKAVFEPLTVTEALLYAKETVTATHRLYIAYNDIQEANRSELVEKSRVVIDDLNYDIEAVMDRKGIGRHYELLLKKVT